MELGVCGCRFGCYPAFKNPVTENQSIERDLAENLHSDHWSEVQF